MSRLHITVRHQLSQAEAKLRVTDQLNHLQSKHAEVISDVQTNWHGGTCDAELTLRGFHLTPQIQVHNHEVIVSGDVPFPASLFQSKIEQILRQNLEEALAGPATTARSSEKPKQCHATSSQVQFSPVPLIPERPRIPLPGSSTIDVPARVTEQTPIVFTVITPIGVVSVLDLELSMRMCTSGRNVQATRSSTSTHETTVYRIGPLTNSKAWFAKGDQVLLRFLGNVQATVLAQCNRS